MRRHSWHGLVRRGSLVGDYGTLGGRIAFKFRGQVLSVIQDLSANNPEEFEERWPQLKEALQEAGVVTHEDWQRCMLSCPHVAHVARQAAQATLAEGSVWKIRNEDSMSAVALMLPHAQPRLLEVQMDPEDLRETRWLEVTQRWDGDLRMILTNKEPADDVLTALSNTSCRLVEFWGPISSAAGVSAVAAAASAAAKLRIWLQAPLQLCSLRGKCGELKVYTSLFDAADGEGAAAPLPSQPAPWLAVEFAPRRSWKTVAHTVQALAPAGNK